MPKTMETYVDVARRLHIGQMVRIEEPNGDKYMGEVDEVRDSGGGRVVVVLGPGTSCWLIEEPEPYTLSDNTFIEFGITPTTRVDPQ